MVYCKDLSLGKIYFWLFLKASNLRKRILTNSGNKTINKEHTTWVQEHVLHSLGTGVHPRFFSSGVHVCSIFSFQSKCFVDHCLSFCPFSFSHCNASFFDLRILITHSVSSNFHYKFKTDHNFTYPVYLLFNIIFYSIDRLY